MQNYHTLFGDGFEQISSFEVYRAVPAPHRSHRVRIGVSLLSFESLVWDYCFRCTQQRQTIKWFLTVLVVNIIKGK